MTEITLAGLTAATLAQFSKVYAVDPAGDQLLIWDSRVMPGFRGPNEPTPLTRMATIRVASLDEADVEPARVKLAAADPHGGRRVIRRTNGWPDPENPGWPSNPDAEGPHLLIDNYSRRRWMWWTAWGEVRLWSHGVGSKSPVEVAEWTYIGPANTPDGEPV